MAEQLSETENNLAIIEKEMRLALLSVWHTFDINKRVLLFAKILAEIAMRDNQTQDDLDFFNALIEEEQKMPKIIAD